MPPQGRISLTEKEADLFQVVLFKDGGSVMPGISHIAVQKEGADLFLALIGSALRRGRLAGSTRFALEIEQAVGRHVEEKGKASAGIINLLTFYLII